MNCSNLTMAQPVKLFQMIVYIPTLVFGLVFNALALWVFCCRLTKWTETRVYMINLIISDCSLLLTLPFQLYAYNHNWTLGSITCSALHFIYFLNMYMSISTITIVAVDRYVAIRHPLKSKGLRSPAKAAVVCILLWIILLSFRTYLTVYDSQRNLNQERTTCFQKTFTRPMKRIVYFTVFGFILPSIILSFCSIQVIRTLKKKMNSSLEAKKSIQKAIQIVTANLAVFMICFLPSHIGKLIRFALEFSSADCSVLQSVHTYGSIAKCVSDLNCCLDAICYYFVVKEFREASYLLPTSKSVQPARSPTQEASL